MAHQRYGAGCSHLSFSCTQSISHFSSSSVSLTFSSSDCSGAAFLSPGLAYAGLAGAFFSSFFLSSFAGGPPFWPATLRFPP